jgi:hypothetical protein
MILSMVERPEVAGTSAGERQLTGIVKSADSFRAASSGDRLSGRDPHRSLASVIGYAES